jgi:hypothetical protein
MADAEQKRQVSIIKAGQPALEAVYRMVESLVGLGASSTEVNSAIEGLRTSARERAKLLLGQKGKMVPGLQGLKK